MLKIVVFKWQQGSDEKESIPSQKIINYTVEHVNRHFRMVKKHVHVPFEYICITDTPDHIGFEEEILTIPLWDKCRNLGGCYNRLYVFSDDMKNIIGDRFICMDIDMVITSDITDLLLYPDDFIYYEAPNSDGSGTRFNCGMFMMDAGSRKFVWDMFYSDPEKYIDMAKSISMNPGTDQSICNMLLELDHEQRWNKLNSGIYDMRQDFIEKNVTELPNDCCIVMWPGPRDPSQPIWKEKYLWIERCWK